MSGEILIVVGTRPEAIKIAPLILELRKHRDIVPILVNSGQQQDVVAQVLADFGLRPDVELAVRRRSGSQAELAADLLPKLDELILRRAPRAVVIQGDTATGFASALSAFWRGVPVVHLEAGLRTRRIDAPFPEEANRQMIARIASLHLAPTPTAASALVSEGIPAHRIEVTGNTGVDAIDHILHRRVEPRTPITAEVRNLLSNGDRVVMATVHRRESWEVFTEILGGLLDIVDGHPDVHLVFPVHPNPRLSKAVHEALGGHPRISVTEPLAYSDFIWILCRAALVVTDSAGVQEEAASFHAPVLVTREITERMETVISGDAKLVGTDPRGIRDQARQMLAKKSATTTIANPYGDGRAAGRVVAALAAFIGPASRKEQTA